MEKALKKYAVNTLEEYHVTAFSHKVVGYQQKKTLHKRVSGGLLLSMFQNKYKLKNLNKTNIWYINFT